MPSSSGQILQEYLVKLGYTTDLVSLRKFEDSLGSTGKRIYKLGGIVSGVVAATNAAASAFAYNMRKTYFASELANSSVKNLKALSYAGRQVGISGEQMSGAIKGMAQAMRLNPGLQGLVESFGIKVSGRDTSDVMMDFVKALKDMPEFAAQQYASMFGIDPDTYHQMISHYDTLLEKRKENLRLQKEMGIDIDAQKNTVLEYTQILDQLTARFGALSTRILSNMLPAFKSTAKVLSDIMQGWAWFLMSDDEKKAYHDERRAERKAKKAKATHAGGPTTPEQELHERIMRGEQTPAPGKPLSREAAKGRLASLEKQYGLPEGLLYKVWGAESAYGKNMKSAAGAEGHFQFMPQTAKEYGLKDPYDFNESSDAAARKFQNLIRYYKGDVNKAVAAYNWGEGNVNRKGLQNAPQETVGYVNKITGADIRLGAGGGASGVTQTNNTTINVTGTGAEATAKAVANAQDRVLGNSLRNLKGATG